MRNDDKKVNASNRPLFDNLHLNIPPPSPLISSSSPSVLTANTSVNDEGDTMTLDEGTIPDFFATMNATVESSSQQEQNYRQQQHQNSPIYSTPTKSPRQQLHHYQQPPSTPPHTPPTTPTSLRKNRATFPKARIKKIMQLDEDVGKIAAPVPVLVSRCLELFISDLVRNSANIARARSGKTISMLHLKECIESNDKFDFLRDRVQNIQISETSEAINDDSNDSAAETPKKRRRKSTDLSTTPNKRSRKKKDDESPTTPPQQMKPIPKQVGSNQHNMQIPPRSPSQNTSRPMNVMPPPLANHATNHSSPLLQSHTYNSSSPLKLPSPVFPSQDLGRPPIPHVATPLPSFSTSPSSHIFDMPTGPKLGHNNPQIPSLKHLLTSAPDNRSSILTTNTTITEENK